MESSKMGGRYFLVTGMLLRMFVLKVGTLVGIFNEQHALGDWGLVVSLQRGLIPWDPLNPDPKILKEKKQDLFPAIVTQIYQYLSLVL